MTGALTPSPATAPIQATEDREGIARIIAPQAWKWADNLRADAATRERPEIVARLLEKAGRHERTSLAKASAIIALRGGKDGLSQGQPGCAEEEPQLQASEPSAVLVPVWPSIGEIQKAGWAWRNDKERETDSGDQRYFEHNWHSLPGLGEYVTAEIRKRREFASPADAPTGAPETGR